MLQDHVWRATISAYPYDMLCRNCAIQDLEIENRNVELTTIDTAEIEFMDQGTGAPITFVHGAMAEECRAIVNEPAFAHFASFTFTVGVMGAPPYPRRRCQWKEMLPIASVSSGKDPCRAHTWLANHPAA
jgi:hypothetical protein